MLVIDLLHYPLGRMFRYCLSTGQSRAFHPNRASPSSLRRSRRNCNFAHLVDVDLRLPLVVPEKVEATHTDLTEVTRVVLVEVGPVVVLTTGHTTTTGVL